MGEDVLIAPYPDLSLLVTDYKEFYSQKRRHFRDIRHAILVGWAASRCDEFIKYSLTHFWSIGMIAGWIRQSFLDNVDNGSSLRHMKFSDLPRKQQYQIVQSLVRQKGWDSAIGSDDGREVRVYRYVGEGDASQI